MARLPLPSPDTLRGVADEYQTRYTRPGEGAGNTRNEYPKPKRRALSAASTGETSADEVWDGYPNRNLVWISVRRYQRRLGDAKPHARPRRLLCRLTGEMLLVPSQSGWITSPVANANASLPRSRRGSAWRAKTTAMRLRGLSTGSPDADSSANASECEGEEKCPQYHSLATSRNAEASVGLTYTDEGLGRLH